jgi:hypothetical protein
MSNYTIKTSKKDVGMYDHQFCDENGNVMKKDALLENGRTVDEILYYHNIRTVPFMRQLKVDSLETKMEISKNGD